MTDDASSLNVHVLREAILPHMDARSIGAVASTSREHERATRDPERFSRLLATRFGSDGSRTSEEGARGAYVTLVSAIERLREIGRDEKGGVAAAAAVLFERAHLFRDFVDMRRAPDGYEFVDVERENTIFEEYFGVPNHEAYGARGDPGARELAQTLASKYLSVPHADFKTAVRLLMVYREIVVKSRGFGCFSNPPREANLTGSGIHFIMRPVRNEYGLALRVPNEYGLAIPSPDGLMWNVLPKSHEKHCEAARDVSSEELARFTLEDHAEWACEAFDGVHEICHVYPPLSVLLFTEPEAKLFPPSGIIGYGPYVHGGRPTADLERKVIVGDKPTDVRAMDGAYSGFRYPCNVSHVGVAIGFRETLLLNEDDVVRFRLQINIPTGYAVGQMSKGDAGPRAGTQREGLFKHFSRDKRRVSAFLEDGLGKMKMEGIIYETEHGFPRVVLRGRYENNFHPGALLTFYGSVSPTCVSGFCLRDDGAGLPTDVFTFWPITGSSIAGRASERESEPERAAL